MEAPKLTKQLGHQALAGIVLTARTALIAVLACAAMSPSWAQQPQDPPSVVAWLGQTQGDVSFSPAGTDTWAYATPNRPLTTGDQVWVDRGGRAELHVGSTALRLGHESELSFTALNDDNMQWRLSRGTLQIRIRAIFSGQRIEIDTPHLAFEPTSPGSYRIDVDPDSGATRITTWSGEGRVHGDNGVSETIPAGERVIYDGPDLNREEASQYPPADGFDRWAQARDDEESRSTSARYVSREMTGYAALDGHGTWTSDPSYGAVWIPTLVASNWAPYHYGHWAWIEPWGWTWVDDAPWGFAPFHYGRWAWLPTRARWAWVPGRVIAARPVYAPALVVFVAEGGGGTRWSVSVGSGAPGVAWLPLAPGEVYRPGYHVSPRYVSRINQTIVVRNTTVNQTNVYMNQHAPRAIAVVPSQAFVRGEHIRGTQGRMSPDMFKHARFAQAAPIAPQAESRLGHVRIAPVHPHARWPESGSPSGASQLPSTRHGEPSRYEMNRSDPGRRSVDQSGVKQVAPEHVPRPSERLRAPPDMPPVKQPEGHRREEVPRQPEFSRIRPMLPPPQQQAVPTAVPRPPSAVGREDRRERARPDQPVRQPEPARMSPPPEAERRMHTQPPQRQPDASAIRQRPEVRPEVRQQPELAPQPQQSAPPAHAGHEQRRDHRPGREDEQHR